MKQRSEPRLEVNDTVVAEIFRLLVSYALKGFLGLHHRDRVLETLKIFGETALICALMKPLRELFRITRRQVGIPDCDREIDDSLRPQNAVEVLMKQHLRQFLQQAFVELHRQLNIGSCSAFPSTR